MRSLTFSLIAWAIVACSDVLSPNCPEPEPWPKEWSCASAKLASVCIDREPIPETACPEILFHLVSWAMNEQVWRFIAKSLMALDFTFVDETTGEKTQGQAHEITVADSVLYCYYPGGGVEFDFRISSRTQEGECQKVCGMVFMRLHHDQDVGLIVNDQTCLTACPAEDGLWRLTEWRILRSLPPAQAEEGFEGATWGEARRRKWEKNYCEPS